MNAPVALSAPEIIRIGVLEVDQRRVGVDIDYLAEVGVITKLLPFVTSRPEVQGAFSLRGSIVPLLSVRRLCHLDASNEAPILAAVLEHKRKLVALSIDSVSEIVELEHNQIQYFYDDDRWTELVVRSAIGVGENSINILDVPAIFELPDLPFCRRTPTAEDRSVDGSKAYLLFEAGRAHFGLDAVQIFGSVPRQPIAKGPITNATCLGTIEYLSRRIPVLAAPDVLGLGEPLSGEAHEIVVVQFPDNRLLGLAVDRIQRIRFVKGSELRDVPDLFDKAETLFSAVVSEGENQAFILNADALLAKDDLLKISSLSTADPTVSNDERASSKSEPEDTNHKSVRCLVLSAGVQIATPISQVAGIIECPDTLTPIVAGAAGMLGIFKQEDQPIPLVSLAAHVGLVSNSDSKTSRVLLVGPKNRRIGFLVESVDSVEVSDYIAREMRPGQFSDQIVKLKSNDFSAVTPFLDLEEIASRIVVATK